MYLKKDEKWSHQGEIKNKGIVKEELKNKFLPKEKINEN